MSIEFLTLPDELQTLANNLWAELERRGYQRKAEPDPLEYPATPTVRAKRLHEMHFFLVRQTVSLEEIDQWSGYARSCSSDTRVTLCCAAEPPRAVIEKLRAIGIGLTLPSLNGFQYDLEARDLAFHAKAPDRSSLKPKVRALLGEALDRLEKGDWRPAFEDACGILEEECRAYLLRSAKMGRVKYQVGGKTKTPTAQQIKRLTLGALKDVFCSMISQNHIEANLCSALRKLNPDRIKRAHKRKAKGTETALRKRVGTHFWLINNTLSLLV